ncbi:MAG: hypothetical protein ACQEP2_04275 [Actinomycetota bacterium]
MISNPQHLTVTQPRGGRDEMKKASIGLQELKRKIYLKAKSSKDIKGLGTKCSPPKNGDLKAGLQAG